MDTQEKKIDVTNRVGGYAQVTLYGTCSPDVTVEDIRKKYYHEYFGGSAAWVKDGNWGCTRYTD